MSWDDVEVRPNAWRGVSVSGGFAPTAGRWALGEVKRPVRLLAPDQLPPDDWTDDAVGWGVVAPDTDQGTPTDRDAGRDLPEVVRALVAARSGTILRYRPRTDGGPPTHLWRYHAQRADAFRLPIGGGKRGRAVDAVPVFLLLLGGPDELPWSLQYALNLEPRVHAGRLPLTGDALERYVTCLLDGWRDQANRHAGPGASGTAVDGPSGGAGIGGSPTGRAVVWSAEHGGADITRLMKLAVADPVRKHYDGDKDVAVGTMAGPGATVTALTDALTATSPGVVLTTSHGYTGPAGAADVDRLGVPVDSDHALLDIDALLASWQPDGAVWYAHACCGAGCDAPSSFEGLFTPGGELDAMITELAGIGPVVAPLPVALLGAERPARAFVGHVEPTFDWTIQDEATGRTIMADLTEALYRSLLLGHSLGRVVAPFLLGAGALAATLLDETRARVLAGQEDLEVAVRQRIGYLDRRSLVVLGDPAVALPSLAPPAA